MHVWRDVYGVRTREGSSLGTGSEWMCGDVCHIRRTYVWERDANLVSLGRKIKHDSCLTSGEFVASYSRAYCFSYTWSRAVNDANDCFHPIVIALGSVRTFGTSHLSI